MSGARARGAARGLPPPRPVATAMYCLPSAANEIGNPCTDVPSRTCHSTSPVGTSKRPEPPIEVAGEGEPAGRRQHTGQERRPLLHAPDFFQRLGIERRELAEPAFRIGHLEEGTRAHPHAARADLEGDLAGRQLHAGLGEREDEQLGARA